MRIFLPLIFAAAVLSFAFCGSGRINSAASDTLKYDDSGTLTLVLLRHAKSDKSNMNMPDIERPLEASGREEAKEMGEYLKKSGQDIDMIFSSPSVRTKQTLEIICPLIGYDYNKVVWDSSLYACSGEHLVKTIRSQDAGGTVMFVGHNPSVTDAANALQKDQKIEEVKTCGVVSIYFPTSQWSQISADSSKLNFYAKPK